MFRKLFFIATLLALSSIAALAQVSQTPKTITDGMGYPGPIPSVMTNGALYITNYVDDKIEIYDETLTKVKEIAVLAVTLPASYTITKEREYVGTLDEENSRSYYFGGNEKPIVYSTLSDVLETIGAGYDSVYVDAQGNTLFLPTDPGNYRDSDNKKYPSSYYLWQVSTKYLRAYDYCYYNFGYTGNWVESREEHGDMSVGAEAMHYYDMTSGYEFSSPFYATQTLFNTDEGFEYIQPAYSSSPTESWRSENDRDGDGEIDQISIDYWPSLEGMNIVSETGTVLQRVNITSGIHGFFAIAKIGETFYLTQRADEYMEFYAIDSTTSSIKKVGTPIKARVHPTVTRPSQQITVETTVSKKPRTVVVSNAAGQTVWKHTIAAGQTSVQVDASRLSPGVNIVNVSGDKENASSCKVIVK